MNAPAGRVRAGARTRGFRPDPWRNRDLLAVLHVLESEMEPGTYIDTEVGVMRVVPVLPVSVPASEAGPRGEGMDQDEPAGSRDSVPARETK